MEITSLILLIIYVSVSYATVLREEPQFIIGKDNMQVPSKDFCEKMMSAYRVPEFPQPWWYVSCAEWREKDDRKQGWKTEGPLKKYYHPYFRRVLDRLLELKEYNRRMELAAQRIYNNKGF